MNNHLSAQPTPRPSSRPLWLKLGVVILGLVILWYATLSFGVYRGFWHGKNTQRILQWTPLPAVLIGWQPLSFGTYLEQRRAVEQYTQYLQSTTSGVYQAQSASDISATTITKIIRIAVTANVLKKFHITVSDADVQQAYTSQVLQNGDAEQVQATIRQLYGWSPKQFTDNVIRPAIMRDKVQEKLSFDQALSGKALKQAQEVLNLVQATPDSFNELAKKYSDDVYGTTGGDLGFVKQGEQAKEIDEVAFTLPSKQISEIIHTKYGFHIIKPLERKTVDGVDQVHLLQITILAPQVDEYINQQLQKTAVRSFVPGIRWESKSFRAVQR